MQTISATGMSIMNGTTPTGGMTTIRAGSMRIIRNGFRRTLNGVSTTAIMTTLMCGTTAIGGTAIIRTGSANIIMIGRDGVTNEI